MNEIDIAIQKLQQIISIPLGIIFAFYLFLKVTDEVENTIKPRTLKEKFEKALIKFSGFLIKFTCLLLIFYIILMVI